MKKFLIWTLSFCIILMLLPTTLLSAKTVATIGEAQYETLAEAINEASDNDTIKLIEGEIPFNTAIAIKKNLTIQGAGMDKTTIISKSDSAGVFFQIGSVSVPNAITVTFEDMTLSGFGDEVSTIDQNATVFKLRSDAAAGTEFIGKNLRVEKFHRSAFAFFSGSFTIEDCVIDCANSNESHLTKGIQAGPAPAGRVTGTVKNTTIINAAPIPLPPLPQLRYTTTPMSPLTAAP